jgi:trigger factor
VKTQVMDALAGANEIEVPNALIKEETDRLRHEAIHSYGLSHDVQLPDELFADQAKRRVTLGLIIGELVRQQDLKVDPQRVEETLARLAASYEDPQQVIQYYRSQPQAMASVEAMVIEDQVVDWVLEQAKTVDEPVAFDEMMNPSQGAESEASE